MQNFLLGLQLKAYENDFKRFMKIEDFPAYELQTKEASLAVADSQGFDSIAAVHSDPQTHRHILTVSTNLELSEYLIFHEFTHILDSEIYTNGEKIRHAGLHGFTEYHASQIELMKLLRANAVDEVLSFTMDSVISTFSGEKSVAQYVDEKYQHAIELFSRDDFPADLNTLVTATGLLFNYWGLRSICEMYSTNFCERVENESFLKYISSMEFSALNGIMHGWLDKATIELSLKAYLHIVLPLIQEYKLA